MILQDCTEFEGLAYRKQNKTGTTYPITSKVRPFDLSNTETIKEIPSTLVFTATIQTKIKSTKKL